MNWRWSKLGGTLLVLLAAGLLGCASPNPLRAARDRWLTGEPTPVKNALDPNVEPSRPLELAAVPTPPFALDPRLNQDRDLPLAEAIEIALRNSDMIRVSDGDDVATAANSAYDAAIADAGVLAALAAFDTSFGANFATTRINQPPDSFFGPGLVQPVRRDEMVLNGGFSKRLITGGDARLTYNPSPGYLFLPLGSSSFFNPQYVGNLELALRQPLLRGGGTEVTRAPVRIAQFQMEQSAWDFKKSVMENLRGVTEAYYELEAARAAVRAIDEVLPLLAEIVRVQEENLKVKWVIPADVAKAHAQLYYYRQQRAQLQSIALERELQLRNLLRLPPADGSNMVPSTNPTRAALVFDPAEALAAAYANHPDVLRQQISLRIREVEYRVAKNGTLPQFDFQALYRMNGVGQNLGDMLQQLSTATYGDWMLGASFSVPLGRRQARADLRTAEWQLAKERAGLEQVALSAAHRVSDSIRQIHFTYEQYREAESRLKAAEAWLQGARLRYQNPLPADDGQNWLLLSLNDYLAAVRFRTDAAAETAALLARYNGQLIRLEEAKGTLLAYFDIVLVDDPSGLIRPVKATHHEPLLHSHVLPPQSIRTEPAPEVRELLRLPPVNDESQRLPPPLAPPQNPAPELPVPRQPIRPFPNADEDASREPMRPSLPTRSVSEATPPTRSVSEGISPPDDHSPRIARERPAARTFNQATPRPAARDDNRYPLPSAVEPEKYWTPQMPPLFYAP